MFKPLPHPASECPFYRGGWQNFLVATQPDADRQARAGDSDTRPSTTSSRPRRTDQPLSYLGDIKQAGGRQILIDQNGNTLYYGIHVNQAFDDFIHQNHLETADAIRAYPTTGEQEPDLPAGRRRVQVRLADRRGRRRHDRRADPDYISMKTTVPTLRQTPTQRQQIIEDRTAPIPVTVRLLAIHVVFTLPGHPEFIWASFEHSTGTPDRAPPTGTATWPRRSTARTRAMPDPTNHLSDHAGRDAGDYILYKAGTRSTRRTHRSRRTAEPGRSEVLDPTCGPQRRRSTACSRRRSRTPPTPTTRSPR